MPTMLLRRKGGAGFGESERKEDMTTMVGWVFGLEGVDGCVTMPKAPAVTTNAGGDRVIEAGSMVALVR